MTKAQRQSKRPAQEAREQAAFDQLASELRVGRVMCRAIATRKLVGKSYFGKDRGCSRLNFQDTLCKEWFLMCDEADPNTVNGHPPVRLSQVEAMFVYENGTGPDTLPTYAFLDAGWGVDTPLECHSVVKVSGFGGDESMTMEDVTRDIPFQQTDGSVVLGGYQMPNG
jgi:hypothetical protein